MGRRLVVNSSPLILLGRISRLDLLPRLAEQVVVPQAVLDELKTKEREDWLYSTVLSHPGIEIIDAPPLPEDLRRWKLGAGESAVVAFCLANSGFEAVLDDLRARRCAQGQNIPLLGTLGIIIEARRQNVIPVARPLIAAIRGFGYYIEEKLIEEALGAVGETWEE